MPSPTAAAVTALVLAGLLAYWRRGLRAGGRWGRHAPAERARPFGGVLCAGGLVLGFLGVVVLGSRFAVAVGVLALAVGVVMAAVGAPLLRRAERRRADEIWGEGGRG